uniref:Uncharacterized protein n=1 Tax=uncultured marine thaumarchaeote AD1000_40_H03 TaxID=1455914 RepID=A0A075FR64_9ARCH|nr:hypothetical protein [uncultured marine thaumarchaeote AD1000_40_H03]
MVFLTKNNVYDYWIKIPDIDEASYPLIEIVSIQLLSYYAALEKTLILITLEI